MVSEPQSVLRDVISALKQEGSTCNNVTWEKIKLYDISALEFLSFARQDMEEDSERGRINAIGNAKRAIECRADEILTLSNLKSFFSRAPLYLKIQALNKLGVVAPPELMRYIASKRNLLEHEYVRPSREEARNLVGITELFLSSTDEYVEKGYISSAIFTTSKLTGVVSRETISRTREMVVIIENVYKLEFDLKTGALTIRNQVFKGDIKVPKGKQIDWEYYKSMQIIHKETRKLLGEVPHITIVIGDCKEENVTELMKLIWGKAD